MIQVGGDIYGWLRMADGRTLFWIADATGHGASAALLTTLAKLLVSSRDGGEQSAGGDHGSGEQRFPQHLRRALVHDRDVRGARSRDRPRDAWLVPVIRRCSWRGPGGEHESIPRPLRRWDYWNAPSLSRQTSTSNRAMHFSSTPMAFTARPTRKIRGLSSSRLAAMLQPLAEARRLLLDRVVRPGGD